MTTSTITRIDTTTATEVLLLDFEPSVETPESSGEGGVEEEDEEGVSIVYLPFITSLRELFTDALSDVLPYTQNEFFPSTSVPFQLSHFKSLSA